MSKRIDDLIEIVKYMQKKQYILTNMLIHIGCRADMYDDFIRKSFNELDELNVPEFKESK